MNRVTGRTRGASVILLIGSIAAGVGAVARVPPQGPVRAEGHAVADARGPFNALGATLFWGAWGYKFDRARLERNLAALSEAGIDYIRVLGSVGGQTWEDRSVDPRWEDYDAVVTGLTDLVYDRYGMRMQWTVFGGAPFTPPGQPREVLVDRFARMAKGREHKLFAIEVANEARSNGFEGPEGIAELRRLGERLNAQTSVLVSLSAPGAGDACDTYAGADVDVATIHYPRGFGKDGPLRPLQRPWDYPRAYDKSCRGSMPTVVLNNEPIGPESSVSQDDDPSRIAAAYTMTFIANNAAYVLHTGPGIRGGGAADRARRRHANFHELPSFKNVVTALRAAREYLPRGLANWTRRPADPKTGPILSGLSTPEAASQARVYISASGPQFVALILGGEKTTRLRAHVGASLDVREMLTGRVRQSLELRSGEVFELDAADPLTVVGRSKQR